MRVLPGSSQRSNRRTWPCRVGSFQVGRFSASPLRSSAFAIGSDTFWSVSVVCLDTPQTRLTYAEQSIPLTASPPQTYGTPRRDAARRTIAARDRSSGGAGSRPGAYGRSEPRVPGRSPGASGASAGGSARRGAVVVGRDEMRLVPRTGGGAVWRLVSWSANDATTVAVALRRGLKSGRPRRAPPAKFARMCLNANGAPGRATSV